MGTNLYRITSLEGFLSLLLNKKERFVHPIDCWEDTYEGYMLHLLDTEEGTEEVLRELYTVITPNDIKLTIRNYTKLMRARYACYGQCWSVKADSDALWRIYSYDRKAIQIKSNFERIKNTIKASQEDIITIRIGPVKYDIDDKTGNLNQVLYNKSKINEPYYHKRLAFEHEEEVRVIVSKKQYSEYTSFSEAAIHNNYNKQPNSTVDPIKRIIDASKSFDGRGEFYRRNFDNAIFIDIDDLSKYIAGIKVHPQAESWYVDLISKLCSNNGLHFEGKSSLYKSITL